MIESLLLAWLKMFKPVQLRLDPASNTDDGLAMGWPSWDLAAGEAAAPDGYGPGRRADAGMLVQAIG